MNLELKLPSEEDLKTAYERDLKSSFPSNELRPLYNIIFMRDTGKYHPLCAYDDSELIGECFLWSENPGFALMDYLCVTPERRNAGLGHIILSKMREIMPDTVILCEIEEPKDADDPVMAERRFKFYQRNGGKIAGFDAVAFGVHYKIIYWSPYSHVNDNISGDVLLKEYAGLYQSVFSPDKYARHFQIPKKADSSYFAKTPWEP